jgi:hypothetical protein
MSESTGRHQHVERAQRYCEPCLTLGIHFNLPRITCHVQAPTGKSASLHIPTLHQMPCYCFSYIYIYIYIYIICAALPFCTHVRTCIYVMPARAALSLHLPVRALHKLRDCNLTTLIHHCAPQNYRRLDRIPKNVGQCVGSFQPL